VSHSTPRRFALAINRCDGTVTKLKLHFLLQNRNHQQSPVLERDAKAKFWSEKKQENSLFCKSENKRISTHLFLKMPKRVREDEHLLRLTAENKKLKKSLSEMQRVYKWACNDKPFDLHWLGRRDINQVLDGGSPRASRPGVVEILMKYPKEGETIRNGGFESNWEMGFWSGVVALGRLVAGVDDPTEIFDQHPEEYGDGDQDWNELSEKKKERVRSDMVANEWDEFPVLDS